MIIVKIGGGKNIPIDSVLQDFHNYTGEKILIHGANHAMDTLCTQLGITPKEIVSPSGMTARYTDTQVRDIFTMVYPGLVNTKIVAHLQSLGTNAVGLSGVDGKLWQGKRKKKILSKENGKVKVITDNYSGKVSQVNTDLLKVLLKNDYIPVLSSPGISFEGEILNVDNDIATAQVAGDMGIKEIVMLFDAPGFMRDIEDPNSKIKTIHYEQIDDLLPYAHSTMKKKMLGVKKALELGVEKIYFGDANILNPIQQALEGNGTTVFH